MKVKEKSNEKCNNEIKKKARSLIHASELCKISQHNHWNPLFVKSINLETFTPSTAKTLSGKNKNLKKKKNSWLPLILDRVD